MYKSIIEKFNDEILLAEKNFRDAYILINKLLFEENTKKLRIIVENKKI